MVLSIDRLFALKRQVDAMAKETRDNGLPKIADCCERSSQMLKLELAERLFQAEEKRRV